MNLKLMSFESLTQAESVLYPGSDKLCTPYQFYIFFKGASIHPTHLWIPTIVK